MITKVDEKEDSKFRFSNDLNIDQVLACLRTIFGLTIRTLPKFTVVRFGAIRGLAGRRGGGGGHWGKTSISFLRVKRTGSGEV